jgi:GGDEF domain-containing protein
MQVFDKINPMALERREFQLGVLAISTIGVMAAGLATFMYQAAFSVSVATGDQITRKIFFSFCALSVLMVGYLLNRQMVIYRLRKKHVDDENRLAQIRNQASSDLIKTLPGLDRFQDRLAMEFRRCTNSEEPLSVVLFVLNPNSGNEDSSQIANIYGDAAKAILLKMRNGSSLYLFGAGAFGVVLPGLTLASAARVGERFSRGLMDASDSGVRFSFTSQVINYPEEFGSAREMELAVRAALPARIMALSTVGTEDDTMVEMVG